MTSGGPFAESKEVSGGISIFNVSSKKQAAGVILAITLGKAALLKPRPEKSAKSAQP